MIDKENPPRYVRLKNGDVKLWEEISHDEKFLATVAPATESEYQEFQESKAW